MESLALRAVLAANDVINEAPPAARAALVGEVADQMRLYAEQVRRIPDRVTTTRWVLP